MFCHKFHLLLVFYVEDSIVLKIYTFVLTLYIIYFHFFSFVALHFIPYSFIYFFCYVQPPLFIYLFSFSNIIQMKNKFLKFFFILIFLYRSSLEVEIVCWLLFFMCTKNIYFSLCFPKKTFSHTKIVIFFYNQFSRLLLLLCITFPKIIIKRRE